MRMAMAVLLVAVLAAGCGDDSSGGGDGGGGGGSVSLDQLGHEIAVVYCAQLEACAGQLVGVIYEAEPCVDQLGRTFDAQEVAQIRDGVTNGTITYDPAAARRCL